VLGEVARILKPGGHFINQQVDGLSDRNIAEVIQQKANDDFLRWNLAFALRGMSRQTLLY